jgi:hypothetical protein
MEIAATEIAYTLDIQVLKTRALIKDVNTPVEYKIYLKELLHCLEEAICSARELLQAIKFSS